MSDQQNMFDRMKPHLHTLWSAHQTPPPEFFPAAPDPMQSRPHSPNAGLFIGAVVIVMSPHFAQPQPALIVDVHDPETDDAMTVTGTTVSFNGERPRIDAVAVLPIRDDPEHTIELTTIQKCPHRIDAERACMLADGNTKNLINVTYYVAVHHINAS